MKLTKIDMAKVVVTALYSLDELVTEKNTVAWKHAKKLTRMKKDELTSQYNKAVEVINQRNKQQEEDMNENSLEKDLKDVLQKHGLNLQYLSIDHEKISNDFYTTNNSIFDSNEYWFEEVYINTTKWLLSQYDTEDIQTDFEIRDFELIYDAVCDALSTYSSDIKSEYNDLEGTTLGNLKECLAEKVYSEVLKNIIHFISGEDFSNIEEHLGAWFGIDYPYETFNKIEALAYWTIYFNPCIWDEDVAWKLGLIPFSYDGENYLALGGCGMDLSPKLDAYQALTDGTIPSSSRFRDDHDYAKYVVGEKIFNKVKEIVKCDPLIHIQTEVSNG